MRRDRRPPPLSPRSFHVAIAKAVRGNDPAASGPSKGPAVSLPLVQAPCEPEGTPIDPSDQNGTTCVKGCDKKCPKNKCVKTIRRTVKFKDDSSTQAETSESEAQTSEDSSKASSKGKKTMAKKANGNESSNAASSEDEDESDVQPDEASTDGDNDSTSEGNASSGNDDPDWTISQDCLLRGMKEGDHPLPWEEIATALGKTKTDVLALSSTSAETGSDDNTSGDADDESESDTDQESDEDEEEVEEVEIEESNEYDEEDEDEDEESDLQIDSDSDSDDDSDDSNEYEEASSKAKGKRPMYNKWHTGRRNNKVAAENKTAKANAKAKVAQQNDQYFSGEDASSESSDIETSSSDSQLIIGDESKRADMRYLQGHVYKLLYPPEIHPEPDENFCRKDCELLGSIDSKYKKNRWLEMQANFFNVTGRLIPLELIRDKCERAEAERAEKEARRAKRAVEREEEGREMVKQWVQDVPEEDESGDCEEPEEEESDGCETPDEEEDSGESGEECGEESGEESGDGSEEDSEESSEDDSDDD
ncbi:hypothetical protein CDV31_008416 [Fusarium ambrosium]|uniref:Uncharacterized protein n=1 Tax=Fusarium ambrosium TaxID=131363 RepID=A0A428U0R9_9HYPO|nr:hypothetical protein CDV31_008416 [Fusarium ambrosium]